MAPVLAHLELGDNRPHRFQRVRLRAARRPRFADGRCRLPAGPAGRWACGGRGVYSRRGPTAVSGGRRVCGGRPYRSAADAWLCSASVRALLVHVCSSRPSKPAPKRPRPTSFTRRCRTQGGPTGAAAGTGRRGRRRLRRAARRGQRRGSQRGAQARQRGARHVVRGQARVQQVGRAGQARARQRQVQPQRACGARRTGLVHVQTPRPAPTPHAALRKKNWERSQV